MFRQFLNLGRLRAGAAAVGTSGGAATFAALRRYSSGNKDYYKTLGVARDADVKEIKKAYRKRALETHPDQGGNKEEFAEVSEAYEVLSNADKRRVYDNYGSEAASNPNMGQGGFGGFGGAGGRSAEDIFAEFFRGGGMGGVGDMFGGRRSAGPPTVQPLEVRLRLTLEEVYKGATKKLRVTRPQVCSECTGFGTKSKSAKPTCTQCNGQGSVIQQHRMGPGMVQQTISECPRCHGTGSCPKADDVCGRCSGKGHRSVTQEVSIDIPAGVPSNVTLVVRGEGGTIPNAQPGDLHVHVEVGPHRVFERKGDDLIVRREVTLAEALLGLHMPLKMLDGRTVNVETTAETILKPNGVIKVPGEGMHSSTGGRGDVYIYTDLKMPAKLTKEQRSKIEEALGTPARDENASSGNTVKARVMRESQEQLEEQKRGVWAAQGGDPFGGSGRQRGRQGHPGMGQAECAQQ